MRTAVPALVLAIATISPGQAQSPATVAYQAVNVDQPGSRLLRAVRSLSIDESSGCVLNRVRSIAARADGGLLLANAGNSEICLLSPDGRLVRRVGRGGGGPGEYRDIHSAQAYRGDSILVADLMLRRLSILGPDGVFVRSISLSAPADGLGSITRVLALADGSVLVGFSEVTRMDPRPEPVVFGQRIYLYGPAGNVIDDTGRFTESEHFVQATAPQFGGVAYWDRAFGRRFAMAPLGDGFIGGDGAEPVLRHYDPSGEVIAIHRLPVAVKLVTEDDIGLYRRDVLARVRPERRSAAVEMLEHMPYPKTFPAYDAVLSDGGGRLWVKVSTRPGSGEQWLVLDQGTRATAVFVGPTRFSLMAVTGSSACGVLRDDVDVESVLCFALQTAN